MLLSFQIMRFLSKLVAHTLVFFTNGNVYSEGSLVFLN